MHLCISFLLLSLLILLLQLLLVSHLFDSKVLLDFLIEIPVKMILPSTSWFVL